MIPGTNLGAVPDSDRIAAIDVLRGYALLGILLMNIQSFAMIGIAYMNPNQYGDLTGLNYWVWMLSHVFADQKFMTIFSMLFGAGIVLMCDRQEAKIGRSAAVHYRRMAVLLLFGLAHAYLIWFGDILVTYALCGMLVYVFRRRQPVTLVVVGLLFLAIHSGLYAYFHWSMQHWSKEAVAAFYREMNPSPADVQNELTIYRGGWLGQLPLRVSSAIFFQTILFGIWAFWRASGLMLIGMALFKLGFFSAKQSATIYRIMFFGGLLIGIPIIVYGYKAIEAHEWDAAYAVFVGDEFNYWGSLFVSAAYVGMVMRMCQSQRCNWLKGRLAAVGQMALTNYLVQSIICTLIFYGHGLGLFGSVSRVGHLGIVLCVWAFQLIASPIWLAHFRFGPAEYVWRALTYGRLPPLRRSRGNG